MKFTPQDIDRARKILGLDEEATIGEIKENYYRLSKKYHPDKCGENKKECEERFKQITWAYRLIMEYVSFFRISFRKGDVEKMKIDKITYRHLKQFYDKWWGDLEV